MNNLKKRLEKRRIERIEDNNNNNTSSSSSSSAEDKEERNQKLLADLMEIDKEEIEEVARMEEETLVETQEKRKKMLDIVKDQYSIYSTRIDEDMKFRKENSKKLLKERLNF